MWACAVLGFRPDEARNWTRYAFASRWGVEGRSPDEGRVNAGRARVRLR